MASVNISHIGNNVKANVNDCDTIIDDDKTRNCVSDAKKSKFNTPSDLETVKTEDNKEFKFSLEPTLENIRQMQADFSRERNWGQYHTPRNLLLAMVGEVGELSEIFQWRGEVKQGLPGWSDADKTHLSQELSDVLIYLIRLSEQCGIDLPQAAKEKIRLNAIKYPANRVYGSNKKYNEYEET